MSIRKSLSLQFASVSHLLSLNTIFLLGTIISIYQPYSYETSILLPKVIIGTLFLSHSLRQKEVSGVKLKHVNMFRQVPQTLLEFLDHCFRQHPASLWVETYHPKDTGQSIKSWKISRSSQQCTSGMNSSSFPGLLHHFSTGLHWSHSIVRELGWTVDYAVYLFFGKINQNGSDKRCKKTHNVLISAKNAPCFE